ncbi:MAG: hypothetical protein II000_04985, partial [Clostridia bacterium]|nr:hypothetical protein [Clostridia bacterium]
EIKYEIKEVKVPKYKVKITGPEGTTTKRFVVTNTYTPPDEPPTGDNSNLWLWITLLGVSTAAIAVLAVFLVRRKRKE